MWTQITSVGTIPLREGRAVNLGDREVAIFNLGDRFAAIDAECPHRGGPLCDGIVTACGPSLADGPLKGHAVVCPLHGWKIDLDSGDVIRPEVSVRVETYKVRVNAGIVEIDVPGSKRKVAA